MFCNYSSLTYLNLLNFNINIQKVEFDCIFDGCKSLKKDNIISNNVKIKWLIKG